MATLLAVVSDTHINSTVGLIRPQIQLDDGGTYKASKSQRQLWAWWLDYWENVPKADRTIGIFAGDIVEGDTKKRSNQVISRNRSAVLSMAIDTLEPALDVCDSVYIIRGTSAHVGKSGELEELLAQDITTAVHAEETASWWYLEAVCEGVKFFAAHHTTMGRLPWTFANAANRNALEAFYYYTNLGKLPPQILMYAHNHLFANSGRGNYPSQCFHLPAWQLSTSYTNRKPLGLADIGGLFIICKDGDYSWQKKIYTPTTSKIWKNHI